MKVLVPNYEIPLNPVFDWLGGWLLAGFIGLLAIFAAMALLAICAERLRFEVAKARRPHLVAYAVRRVRLGGRYGTQRAF